MVETAQQNDIDAKNSIPAGRKEGESREDAFTKAEVLLRKYEAQQKQTDTATTRRVRNYMHKLDPEAAEACGIKFSPSSNMSTDNKRAKDTDLPKLKKLFPDFPDLC